MVGMSDEKPFREEMELEDEEQSDDDYEEDEEMLEGQCIGESRPTPQWCLHGGDGTDECMSLQEVWTLWEEKLQKRNLSTVLPDTVTELHTADGGRVFIVGTAHFSKESIQDVAKNGEVRGAQSEKIVCIPTQTIRALQPDVVVIELCRFRVSMLSLNEETLLQEVQELSLEKLRQSIRQMLLLKVSAHITEQLGVVPGGEFRQAYREAALVPFCRFHLGDRPIPVTLRRAFSALSFWQKIRLAWDLLFLNGPLSSEDVEQCKQKDLLEQMMAEMIGEFPDLHRTIVAERDVYLTHSLRQSARPVSTPPALPGQPAGRTPAVVVGVVGIGHVLGIKENWNKQLDIRQVVSIPPPSMTGRACRIITQVSFLGLACYACFRLARLGARLSPW
uniref:traB domain-containing protein-like isoform X2 n=1 Tax=Myxine glutinosa TaxID=7769 RepID=UPI003590103E